MPRKSVPGLLPTLVMGHGPFVIALPFARAMQVASIAARAGPHSGNCRDTGWERILHPPIEKRTPL
ncbi:hypothetical protein StoSoilB19_21450 [Arthrobacter sp. StoSoilB19]|nr:hypothetical protein StoSoilB19_21450 [Arthrobacter sp. StoSoilB19]